MKKIAIFITIAVAINFVFAESSQSETLYAKSSSYNDVNSMILAANSGDTVVIPPGNATWNNGITIKKSLILKGSGVDSTVIYSASNVNLVTISLSSDVAVRITGIYFKFLSNNPGGSGVYIAGGLSSPLTKIRIDNNKFEKGTRGVHSFNLVYGVIDSNTFLNCNTGVGISSSRGNTTWERAIEAGTANALFIEDNSFLIDSNVGRWTNDHIMHQNGVRTVTRYNKFDFTGDKTNKVSFLDNHGNQGYYSATNTAFRGQPIIEWYNNNMKAYSCYRAANLRGGSILFFNNVLTTIDGSGCPIGLTEEEAWQTQFFAKLRTTWPAEDQITNSFFWNNTINDKPITVRTWNEKDAAFIKKDRDFFLHEPRSTGGKTIFPTRKGASDMVFIADSENAYFPYTPFVYPHPIRNGDTSKGFAPPARLRVD